MIYARFAKDVTSNRLIFCNYSRLSKGPPLRALSGTSTHPKRQRVIVVRHGETDWNKALRVQGSTDIPLNDKGLAQAQMSAGSISKLLGSSSTATTIYSSPLVRAKETALAIGGGNVVTSEALTEWNLGALEGLTKDQAMKDQPEDWRVFSRWADPFTPLEDAQLPLTNGENMEEVRWRAVNFINTIAMKYYDTNDPLIFVTHGGVLGQLLRHVVQSSQTDPARQYNRPGNACISRFLLETTAAGQDPQWKIESWADTSHLTGDLAPIGADYDEKKK